MTKNLQKLIFFTSLIITAAIFSIGILINYGLDYIRIDAILNTVETHELDIRSYSIQQEFIDAFGGNKCEFMQLKVNDLKEELKQVGVDLSNYGGKSFFKKKDFDYLKRKYFLLELNFYNLIEKLNKECGKSYIPIIFFYETDDYPSERQGYILDDVSKLDEKVIVLSFDKDYPDEPLLNLLKLKYNITKVPTTIIDNKLIYDSIVYSEQIKAVIRDLTEIPDLYGRIYDFEYVLKATGTDKKQFIYGLKVLLDENISDFARGDIMLMLGRLEDNDALICSSLRYYENVETKDPEENALIYETYAAIGCGKDKKESLLEAAELWEELGVDFRSKLLRDLAYENKLNYTSDIKEISPVNISVPSNTTKITIGNSYIKLDDSDILLSQTDRVSRDWLSYQVYSSPFSPELLTTFSERFYLNETELLSDIGWHEGARIKELKQSGLKHEIGTGTIVKKINGEWYAPNEEGVFMFDVPLDKVLYPTTRFLREDLAVIIDTHGINMLVEQAIRKNASVVVGCCDNIGKIKAVHYLSSKGIKSICFTDKYIPFILGSNDSVLGSPPIEHVGNTFILGNRTLFFDINENIIVMNVSSDKFQISYYTTPSIYFSELEKRTGLDLNIIYFEIDDFNQMSKLIEATEIFNSSIIAVRIFNSDDYNNVKKWLEEDNSNRAILFHSTSYPYGYKLFKEFPERTSFDDINVEFN